MAKKAKKRNAPRKPAQKVAAPTTLARSLAQSIYSGTPVDVAVLQQAEAAVTRVWTVGDVVLDLYEVKEVFTGGGMGLVYRVYHRGWNRDLVVKSPRPEYFRTDEHKQNFVREIEAWVSLGLHPHIVNCYYARVLGGIPRVFAEYIPGGSLADWMRQRKLYEGKSQEVLERIMDVAIQIAWGLHYAHEQGLIHQDMKPANVMMTQEGLAKVTDFGQGMTPAYCSPEQARREALSRKTDIWSWGLSVLEMFTGEVTWRAGQVAAEALEGYVVRHIFEALSKNPRFGEPTTCISGWAPDCNPRIPDNALRKQIARHLPGKQLGWPHSQGFRVCQNNTVRVRECREHAKHT